MIMLILFTATLSVKKDINIVHQTEEVEVKTILSHDKQENKAISQVQEKDALLQVDDREIAIMPPVQAWLAEQGNRINRIDDHCGVKRRPGKRSLFTSAMFIDHHNRILYCAVPKAACSSWKQMIWQLGQESTKTREELLNARDSPSWPSGSIHRKMQQYGLMSPGSLSKQKRAEVLKSYTKIMTVRHPLERIKSVYRDKLYVDPRTPDQACQSCKDIGRQILRRVRGNHTRKEIQSGRGVTFHDFLQYVTKAREPHWNEQHGLCNPCHVKYDYVMKVETMREDAKQVISRVFNSTLPFISSNPSDKHITQDYNIPNGIMEKLHKRYQLDLDMFNYDWH